ncbi:signal peptidase I [Kribbella albertanoniae]|uniref:Signal peptidase I n=2 Tax=Kribbella albertanoniae TaxID=1266829 RepID=A0A4R4PSW5_9ACTN|nr:signal peptidase I [Kribbella albertanoniae]
MAPSTATRARPRSAPRRARRSKGRHRRLKQRNPLLSLLTEMTTVTVLALVITVVLRLFVAEAFYVPSESMYNTLTKDDRILAEKISYLHRDVDRGDIVVFKDPANWLNEEPATPGPFRQVGEFVGILPRSGEGHLVKRVIGLPGDKVICCDRNGRVTVNGIALDEREYLLKGAHPSDMPFNVVVPPGQLWVMGDNRAQSADSRAHMGGPGGGFVPIKNVVGRACCVIWPSDRMTMLRPPETFKKPGLKK